MRGKMRVSLPDNSGSRSIRKEQGEDRGRKARERVAAREQIARSMDGVAEQKAEKRLIEAQACLDRHLNEWKMLQEGKAGPSVAKFITARRTQLLKNISDMRKKVNSEVSLLYCHEMVNGGTGRSKVGRCGYPDLNNPSSAVMAMQRIGLPVMMDEMPIDSIRDRSDDHMGDEELMAVLTTFKDLGVEGRRYTFFMNNNRDSVSIRIKGSNHLRGPGTLKDLIGPDLGEIESLLTIVERPQGSGTVFSASMMKNTDLVQLEPLETESTREASALPFSELLEEWSSGRSGLTVKAPSGPLGHIRTALQVAGSVLLQGGPVIIELEGPDGKDAREYLVDELDMESRKFVIIDPLKPRGVEKTETFYGGDIDKVLERWGRRDYIITTFWRDPDVADGI